MLHTANIITHISAGLIAMGIGIFIFAKPKGGTGHRQLGRVFLGLMSIVIVTALAGTLLFIDRPFLTIVTIQSFYFSYSGYRVVQTKAKGFERVDFGMMILVLAIVIWITTQLSAANVLWHSSVVYYLLVYLYLVLGFDMLRYAFPKMISHPRFWLYEHTYKMTSAFGALVSAGMGTVLVAWEPWNQIIPAMSTSFWLIFCVIYFPRKLQVKIKHR